MLYINLHSSAKQDIRIKLVTATSKSQNLDGSAQEWAQGPPSPLSSVEEDWRLTVGRIFMGQAIPFSRAQSYDQALLERRLEI